MKKPLISAVSLASLLALTSATAMAEARSTPGYATDSNGNVIMSSYGDCVRSGSWSEDKATVEGCDGYTLENEITMVKGQPIAGGVVAFTLPFAELFDFNKTDLKEDGKAFIDQAIQEARGELTSAYSVTVVGHTDNTGSDAANKTVSDGRAQSVADYLISKGVNPDKIRTVGVGASEPIAPNDTSEGRAMNRRAEIYVVAQPKALDRMIMPSVALFERRSSELSQTGYSLLDRNAKVAIEQFKRAVLIEVVGHTDDVGDDAYNDELSMARAKTIGAYIESLGINPDKIVLRGAGKHDPVASNATDEGRRKNRRVEVLLVGRARQ